MWSQIFSLFLYFFALPKDYYFAHFFASCHIQSCYELQQCEVRKEVTVLRGQLEVAMEQLNKVKEEKTCLQTLLELRAQEERQSQELLQEKNEELQFWQQEAQQVIKPWKFCGVTFLEIIITQQWFNTYWLFTRFGLVTTCPLCVFSTKAKSCCIFSILPSWRRLRVSARPFRLNKRDWNWSWTTERRQ